MDLGIDGRVALVLGASQGIGRGIAASLAREGARVALASRSRERLAEAAAAIDGDTGIFEADTADLERMGELPGEVKSALGPVEILIANTGGPPPGGALAHGPAEWRAAYESLVLGPRVLIEAALGDMRERGWGRIISVGSTATVELNPTLALSNAHRLATVGFLKTLAREVAAEGVTVNTIATGRIATNRLVELSGGSLDDVTERAAGEVPAGRLGTPDEYGDLVAFLASERAAYLTGAVIPLDGGLIRSV